MRKFKVTPGMDMHIFLQKRDYSDNSGIKHEILPFCSLHRLALDIGITYNELSYLFGELTDEKHKGWNIHPVAASN